MSTKKDAPPWVYVLLTLVVVGVGWVVWASVTSGDRANQQLTEDADKAEEALRDLREEREKRN